MEQTSIYYVPFIELHNLLLSFPRTRWYFELGYEATAYSVATSYRICRGVPNGGKCSLTV